MPVIDAYTLRILLGRKGHRDLNNPNNVGLESVCVKSVDYTQETGDMIIEFVNRGTYQYHNVPLTVYAQMATAASQGQFFNLYIRNNYSYERIS